MSHDLPESEDEHIKTWDLPFIEDERKLAETQSTDALNHRPSWQYEPPEEVQDEEFHPPTAQEIEAIRCAAQADGFSEGRQKGFAQGQTEGMEEGHTQGLAQGLEEGKAQGLAQGQEEQEKNSVLWQQLIQTLYAPVAIVEHELQQELVLLAVSLAKAVIRSEIETNTDIIFAALSEGLKALPIQESEYQIHLHPQDIELIKDHFSEQDIEKHKWQLIEAPNLTRGGCDIVTQSNAVDVSIERRVRDILDTFLLEQGLAQVDPNQEV
ncbi:MAG: flagellar assembly protein FliH [Paraglaciecola sp.]|jgi:flagellar assembly protein FliH